MTNEELILEIRKKWEELHEKCNKKEITSKEYAIRRRAYDNITMELMVRQEEDEGNNN
jgi:hypothetical protein